MPRTLNSTVPLLQQGIAGTHATPRRTGRWLQRQRRYLIADNPLCHGPDSACQQLGRTTAGAQRDHIIPLCDGGRDEPSNTQWLCAACHDAKSARELAGRHR